MFFPSYIFFVFFFHLSGIIVGLCDGNFPLSGEWVGGRANSFGITSSGYIWVEGNKVRLVSEFKTGDVIGCGVDKPSGAIGQCRLFFTVNGALSGESIAVNSHFC